jgi:hypothetical protein
MTASQLSQRELLERVRRAREMQPAVRREVEKRIQALKEMKDTRTACTDRK